MRLHCTVQCRDRRIKSRRNTVRPVARLIPVESQSYTNTTKMWTLLLFLFAQFTYGVTSNADIWTHCPPKCRCKTMNYTGLTVDCLRRPYVDSKQLSDQLDSMLSSNMTHGNLMYLKIINSPLTHVPRSVCRLTTLTHLYLDNNRLTRLPDNCLTNLSNLVWFSAYNNAIDTLQDGVLYGLTNLQHLNLNRNLLSSIGLSVFATSSNLSSLLEINLSENNLTSLRLSRTVGLC